MDTDTESEYQAALREQELAALRRERGFYLERDEPDRAAAVEAYLAGLGALEDTADSTPLEQATPKRKSSS